MKGSTVHTLGATSQGDRMSRASASRSGRSGNPNLVCLSADLASLNLGRIKPMTLKLILVTS